MSAAVGRAGMAAPWGALRRYGPLALLLAATAGLGLAGQGVARPLFIAGCVLVAWDLLRFGAGAHVSGCLVLFCLAPLLRRVVDVSVGYEDSGLMISGPLLALLVTVPRLLTAVSPAEGMDPALRPFVLALGCAGYGVLLTVFEGNLLQAASNGLKWAAPVIYGLWLAGEAQRTQGVLRAVVRTLLLLMPALGVYGAVQYAAPPVWDRYWMSYTLIASIGQPKPFMVRVFSTLNAPAGYATFTAAGLVLFGFQRRWLWALLAALPSALGLLLSMYRTAWIALAASIALGLLQRSTRARAAGLLGLGALAVAAIVTLTPAGDALQERLMTFGAAGEDASGQERLAQYAELLGADDGTLAGHGFAGSDVLQAGTMALDGQLIVSWFALGLIVGILNVSAICWAGAQGAWRAWRCHTAEATGLAVALAGLLVQIPLATIGTSEIGFLFWTLAAIGAGMAR